MSSYNFIEAKVVLLGRNYSGKTSLLERYLHNRFDGTTEATIGAAYGTRTLTVNNSRVCLGIWDTAGSERYDAMSRIYYRGAVGAVICYDLTDESSFQRAKYWVNELHTYEKSCFIYLCGTKLDLVEDRRKARAVGASVASQYAESIGARTFETSSKTGKDVERVFFCIAQDCEKMNRVTDTSNGNDEILPTIQLKNPKPKKLKCC